MHISLLVWIVTIVVMLAVLTIDAVMLSRRPHVPVSYTHLDVYKRQGPIIATKDRDNIAALVDRAVEAGAKLETGGEVPTGVGSFYPPTVLTGVKPDAEIMRTEIFGPVAPITTFSTCLLYTSRCV